MGRAPPGVQGESAALVEDVAEDQTRQQLRDEAIEKARTKKTFLSAATVRAAVDERASSAELSRLFDTGVAAAVRHRRRADARGSDYSAQLLLYWGLVNAYAQRIVERAQAWCSYRVESDRFGGVSGS